MSASLTIPTPLGPVEIQVSCGTPEPKQPPATSSLTSGAQVQVWSDVDGLVVDGLLTSFDPVAGASIDFPETEAWGVELRLYASRATADVIISALLPDGTAVSFLSGDEDLETAQFSTTDWELAIGGPDPDYLSREAKEGRQPQSWRDPVVPAGDPAHGRGLAWQMPGLQAGDSARFHIAVAWCATGHPHSEDAPWFAVDTSPAALRAAAGLPPRRRARRSPES